MSYRAWPIGVSFCLGEGVIAAIDPTSAVAVAAATAILDRRIASPLIWESYMAASASASC
ncbi:hypothetical protein FD527_07675 [Cutibacterium acnes]|nr:hypothetical protein FD527_07675 [Cutibacterium acnes]